MTRANRPKQIAEILKTVATKYPDDVATSLEAYIADLEANQAERPAQIAAILQTIDSDYPLDMGIFLDVRKVLLQFSSAFYFLSFILFYCKQTHHQRSLWDCI